MTKPIARIALTAGSEAARQTLLRRGVALYEHVDILQSALAGLVPDIPPPDAQ
jgi:hypothetical protein